MEMTTPAILGKPVSLFLPAVDQSSAPWVNGAQIHYSGPGNGGSTVYQVELPHANTTSVEETPVLVEGSHGAQLVGVLLTTTLHREAVSKWAVVSCSIDDDDTITVDALALCIQYGRLGTLPTQSWNLFT